MLGALDGLSESKWEKPGVCGWWSVKEIIAHLASFELVLVEGLASVLDGGETSTLTRLTQMDPDTWNNDEVGRRQALSPAETLAEYRAHYAGVKSLIGRIPRETLRRTGTLPWYGIEYDLEDFFAYNYYGHKREHCAQINVYRDRLKEEARLAAEQSANRGHNVARAAGVDETAGAPGGD
ncbi:MAG TPA: DinB family protein [Ardenticatenaceae bacterium]|nr:DinB family protein [Ardenticatenaceae bacterium]